jgi:hypothetical protein
MHEGIRFKRRDFINAAQLISKIGWLARGSYTQNDSYCALGALAKVGRASWTDIYDSSFPIGEQTKTRSAAWKEITDFNDDVLRSIEDVQMLLLFLGEIAES